VLPFLTCCVWGQIEIIKRTISKSNSYGTRARKHVIWMNLHHNKLLPFCQTTIYELFFVMQINSSKSRVYVPYELLCDIVRFIISIWPHTQQISQAKTDTTRRTETRKKN